MTGENSTKMTGGAWQWPSDPAAACAILQEIFPGWEVVHQPASVLGGLRRPYVFAVQRGGLLIEAMHPALVAFWVSELADEEVPAWAIRVQ